MICFLVLCLQKGITFFLDAIQKWWIQKYFKGYFLLKKVQYNHRTIRISGFPRIVIKGQMIIGDHFILNSGKTCVTNECESIIEIAEGAILQIGKESGISNSCIHVRKSIIIGNYVDIGSGCFIADSDFHSLSWKDRENRSLGLKNQRTASIVIGNNVFIGARSIILKGVSIGDRSIIGAGSVITKNIPSGQIWAGNPAQFVKKIEDINYDM